MSALDGVRRSAVAGLWMAAVLCFCPPLRAAVWGGGGGSYGGAGGGVARLDDFRGSGEQRLEFDGGPEGLVMYGGQVDPVRVEYRVSYRSYDLDEFEDDTGVAFPDVDGSLDDASLSLNFYEMIPLLGDRASVFWGAGLQLTYVALRDMTVNGSPRADGSDVVLGFQGMVGAEYRLTRDLSVSGEFSLTDSQDVSFDGVAGRPKLNLTGMERRIVRVNLRWFF